MANIARFRGGDARPRAFPTCYAVGQSTAYPISTGDLLFLDPATGCVRSAQYLAGMGTAAACQEAFAGYFVGVAMRKTGAQPGEVLWQLQQTIDPGWTLVGTGGIWEFDCASGVTWQPGDLVSIYAASNGTVGTTSFGTSQSQQVAPPAAGQFMPPSGNPSTQFAQAIGKAVVPFNVINVGLNQGLTPPYAVTPSVPSPPGIIGTPSTCATVMVEIYSTICGNTLLPAAANWNSFNPGNTSGSGQ